MSKYFFTDEAEKQVRAFFDRKQHLSPAKPLAVFDYDGTLIPLGPFSGRARLAAEVSSALALLKPHWTLVILTGRSVEDLASRLDDGQKEIFDLVIGNHGIENPMAEASIKEGFKLKMQALRQTLHPVFSSPEFSEFEIEDKQFSWSVHFPAKMDDLQGREMLKLHLESPDFRLVFGRGLINVIPADAPNKGRALSLILNQEKLRTAKAFFIGDDFTDEDVFIENHPRVFGVRVGAGSQTRALILLTITGKF